MTQPPYEIILAVTGDRARAYSVEDVMLTARTLAEDAAQHQGIRRMIQHSIMVTKDGQFDVVTTTMARGA